MRAWTSAPEGGHPVYHKPGVHILPVADAQPHDNSHRCWCAPAIVRHYTNAATASKGFAIESFVWLHHAADGRTFEGTL